MERVVFEDYSNESGIKDKNTLYVFKLSIVFIYDLLNYFLIYNDCC